MTEARKQKDEGLGKVDREAGGYEDERSGWLTEREEDERSEGVCG
jgi:hypothetical protein